MDDDDAAARQFSEYFGFCSVRDDISKCEIYANFYHRNERHVPPGSLRSMLQA